MVWNGKVLVFVCGYICLCVPTLYMCINSVCPQTHKDKHSCYVFTEMGLEPFTVQAWKKHWCPPGSLYWKACWGFHRTFLESSFYHIHSLCSKEMQVWQKGIIALKKSSRISKCRFKLQDDISNNFIPEIFFFVTWRDFTFLFFHFLPAFTFCLLFFIKWNVELCPKGCGVEA